LEAEKLSWLLPRLKCPSCDRCELELAGDQLACASCSARVPIVAGAIDFLNEEVRLASGLTDTENVSDHPFDGNAMTIIHKCEETGGSVLDCGSGYKAQSFAHVVQMDVVKFANVDVLAVNQQLPFADDSFDAVFSLDVLEHVNDPFRCAAEIRRVLKPGGYLYLDLPFLQAEHGYPHHYFNATRMGADRLFADLDLLSHHVPLSGHPIFTIHQVLQMYLAGLPGEHRAALSRMTVAEIVDRPLLDWLDHPLVTQLDVDARWAIASTTQALFQRSPVPGRTSNVHVSPSDLPGFPEFASRPPGGGRSDESAERPSGQRSREKLRSRFSRG